MEIIVDPLPDDAGAMSPGERRHWGITVRVAGVRDPALAVRVDRKGALARHPAGIEALLEACTEPWSSDDGEAPRCGPGAMTVTPALRPGSNAPGTVFALPPPDDDGDVHLVVTLWLEDSDAARVDRSLMGLSADVDVTVTAWADATDRSEGFLVPTGGHLSGLAAAVVLVLLGLVATAARRRESSPGGERRMGASCRPRRAPPR
ncbi:MAG: hypothetical protein PGN24_01100 [Microbacterium arborescens]